MLGIIIIIIIILINQKNEPDVTLVLSVEDNKYATELEENY